MSDPLAVIDQLRSLRRESATDNGFWERFLPPIVSLCLARSALVVEDIGGLIVERGACLAKPGDRQAVIEASWLAPLMKRAQANRFAVGTPSETAGLLRLAVKFSSIENLYLILLIDSASAHRLNEIIVRAQLIADIPVDGLSGADCKDQAPGTAAMVLSFLDLVAETYQASRFSTAAYTLTNGLVSHSSEIDQAVIGWSEGSYLKVRAVSHMDRFERKTELIKSLEAAMEESADQDLAIMLQPGADMDPGTISLAHRQLQTDQGWTSVFSLPLKGEHDGEGLVIMLIRYDEPLSRDVMESLHFLAQVIHPRLSHLRELEQPLPARWLKRLRRQLAWLVGPEHVWIKTFSCFFALLLLYGMFGTLPHRVEGAASLVTDNVRIAGAPFDGRIDDALVSSGDLVSNNEPLLIMDRQDLLLQQSEIRADLLRNQSEINRARAMMDLVETEIAKARVAQNEARLQRLTVYLEQAEVKAPFDGVIVEGDRQSLLGLSVNQGDNLYKVARLEAMYMNMTVAQIDIHYLEEGDRGEFTFASRPGIRLPFTVRRIIPVATVEDQSGPAFQLKADFDAPAASWWRPGMSGLAKVDKGNRNVLWVIGHRLVDRVRLWLWW